MLLTGYQLDKEVYWQVSGILEPEIRFPGVVCQELLCHSNVLFHL